MPILLRKFVGTLSKACAGFTRVERVKHFTGTALGKRDKAITIVQVKPGDL